MLMTISAVRRATIETVAIDPRKDGKVEVTFRIVADQRGLTDCAAEFIKAGVTGLEMLDVFSVLLPPDVSLNLEAANVSPNVVPFNGEGSVSGAGAVHGCNFSEMNAPLTAANEDAVTEASEATRRAFLGTQNFTAFHDVASRLLYVEEMLTTIYRMMCDHDHASRNGMQAISYGMEGLRRVTKPLAGLVAASVCGHHGICSLLDALMSVAGA